MLAITVVLLAVGALLAALGTIGFLAVIQQPGSDDELKAARKTATVGRWMTLPGLVLYGAHHGAPAGLGVYTLMLIAVLTAATILTKSTYRPAGTTGVAR